MGRRSRALRVSCDSSTMKVPRGGTLFREMPAGSGLALSDRGPEPTTKEKTQVEMRRGIAQAERPGQPQLDLSAVIPRRSASQFLDECLASIARSNPREIIVVDGMSTDGTREIAAKYTSRILSDEGRGLPFARLLGAKEARSSAVALVDSDVVFPHGALEALFNEFSENGRRPLQAGLHSVGPGYWGGALAAHHRSGRSKKRFGLVATIFEHDTLLRYGFDQKFRSGEDIELRIRLKRDGVPASVSRRTTVIHRFEGGYEFARALWLADGHGLGMMVRKFGPRSTWLVGLPLGSMARGIAKCLVGRQPRWIPYYILFAVYNYIGMIAELGRGGFLDRARSTRS
jgi:glycosyltransferase involved in cell wall biosynthesis